MAFFNRNFSVFETAMAAAASSQTVTVQVQQPTPDTLTLRPLAGGRGLRGYLDLQGSANSALDRFRQMFICLDVSGSMRSFENMQREAIQRLISKIHESNIPQGVAYVIFFSNGINGTIDLADSDALYQLRHTCFGGGTSFREPLEKVEQLRVPGSDVDVLFATDGQASGWIRVAQHLIGSLSAASHVCPLVFNTTTGYYGTTSNAQLAQLREHMCLRAGAVEVTDVDMLVQWIGGAIESVAQELQGTVALPDGTALSASLFGNGETAVGITAEVLPRVPEGLTDGDTVTLSITSNGTEVATVEVTVRLSREEVTPQEERRTIFTQVASALGTLADDIRHAQEDRDPASIARVLEQLQRLRDEYARLHLPPKDPLGVRLREAHADLQRIVKSVASRSKAQGTGEFSVVGRGCPLDRLHSLALSVATTQHGAQRKAQRVKRAVERVNERVAANAAAVEADVRTLQGVAPYIFLHERPVVTHTAGTGPTAETRQFTYAHAVPAPEHMLVTLANDPMADPLKVERVTVLSGTGEGLVTLAAPVPVGTVLNVTHQVLDVPEDPITAQDYGCTVAVVVVAGPGTQFTTADVLGGDGMGAVPNPLATAAIDNPASAAGQLQCVLYGTTFLAQIAADQPLFGAQMTGFPAVPWRQTDQSLQERTWVLKFGPLAAMQLICGINTRPSSQGLHALAAVAWSMFADATTPSDVAAAFVLAPYHQCMAYRLCRPTPDWCDATDPQVTFHQLVHELYADVWNAFALSAAENGDGVLASVPASVMARAFAAVCLPDHRFRLRYPAVILETARNGLAFYLTTLKQPHQYLADQTALITTPLNVAEHLAPVEKLDVNDFARKLEPYFRRVAQGGLSELPLQQIVEAAARLEFSGEPVVLTPKHLSVVAALQFLHGLASTELHKPSPTVQRARESWAVLIGTLRRLERLLGGDEDELEGTVRRATTNAGWMRALDAERALEGGAAVANGPELLLEVLTPHEAVWLALVLLKTRGSNGALRSAGCLRVSPDATVDARFVADWVPDDEATKRRRAEAVRALLSRLADAAGCGGEYHPMAAVGLARILLRNGLNTVVLHILGTLAGNRMVLARRDVCVALLRTIPLGWVTTDDAAFAVVSAIIVGYTGQGPLVSSTGGLVPVALLQHRPVVELLRERGVPQTTLEECLRAPGRTTCIPGSQRFNRCMVRLLRQAAADLDGDLDGDHYVLGTTEAATVALPVALATGTLFAGPHNAVEAWYVRVDDDLVCVGVKLQDGTEHSRPAREGHWPTEWIQSMRAWRERVLVASESKVTKSKANKSAKATVAVTDTELRLIGTTVQELLGQLDG